FTKPLPTRERRSKAFNDFFERFLALIRKHTDGVGYPFNAPDRGRRSVLEHLQKLRRPLPDLEREAALAEAAQAKQFNEVFRLGPMERLEFDAHRMDCKFSVELEDASGRSQVRQITYVWLLLLIDAVTRLILGYSL